MSPLIAADVKAEVYRGVYILLEREAEKSRDHGDISQADVYAMLIAKIKALEAGRLVL